VYTNTSYVFYVFAVTQDDHVFSWGRNKTGDLMNGVVTAAPVWGAFAAIFPNSWDVANPTNVNPFELTANVEVDSPYCLEHWDAGADGGNPQCPWPSGYDAGPGPDGGPNTGFDCPCNTFDPKTGKAAYEK
jgi:hypothetical protein